jgi:hypothetical protein
MPTSQRGAFNRLAIPYGMAKGAIGYFRFPEQRESWGGPFNGQRHRAKMFEELQAAFHARTIVETGTYRGWTTDLFANDPGTHVYTVESDPWSYGYCRVRFLRQTNVTPIWGDSRVALKKLSRIALSTPILFYLDAHWDADLPLAGELEIIFGNWPGAIVMIDDFKVERDDDYAFDDYGCGNALCIDYLRPLLRKYDPLLYFPSATAAEETGARRGSVVLIGRAAKHQPVFSTLRQYLPAQ